MTASAVAAPTPAPEAGAPPMTRTYVLTVAPGAEGPRVQVMRRGPEALTAVGLGRSAGDVVRLSGLLFSLCPRAQTAAVLRAIEQAGAVTVPEGQVAAREAAVLAEAVAAGVWRMGVTWPALVGEARDTASVKMARRGSDALAGALFTGSWSAIGGAAMARSGQAAALEAFDVLHTALRTVEGRVQTVIDRASAIRLGRCACNCAVLKDEIYTDGVAPDSQNREETPRALLAPREVTDSLAPWFDAQISHSFALMAALRRALRRAVPDAPLDVCGRTLSGDGLGVAMTARGRVRHAISLRDGTVTTWRAASPTDWNFASGGPVIRTAGRLCAEGGGALDADGLAHAAQWVVAAFDPCSPCQVIPDAQSAVPDTGEQAYA